MAFLAHAPVDRAVRAGLQMQMRMPSETARPIMQYVRELESKVLTLRADRRNQFLVGMTFGAATTAVMAVLLFVLSKYLR